MDRKQKTVIDVNFASYICNIMNDKTCLCGCHTNTWKDMYCIHCNFIQELKKEKKNYEKISNYLCRPTLEF